MRIIGICHLCLRIKYVRAIFSMPPQGHVYLGICDDCEDPSHV